MSFVENFITTSLSVFVAGLFLIGFCQSDPGKKIVDFMGGKIDSIAERMAQGSDKE